MLTELTLKQLKTALEETQSLPYSLFAEASTPDNWKRVRENARYEEFWRDVEVQAERWLQSPPSSPLFSEFILFGETGDREIYQKKAGQLSSGLHLFSLLAMTDGGTKWNTGLGDAIWSICNEYTWVMPAHVGLYRNEYPNGIWDQPEPPRETVDLYAGGIAFALAEILHHHRERLHPWVVLRARQEIERRILKVYFDSPIPQNWELKTNNWPAVCASCIGAVAVYMVEDSEVLAGMLWRVIGVLRNYIAGFDEQGATPEGPGYGHYGFSYFVYFAELLKERTQGRISLLADKKVGRIALFPQTCLLSGGKVINFSDNSDQVNLNEGVMHRLRDYESSLRPLPDAYRAKPYLSWVDASRLLLWSSQCEPSGRHAEQAGVEEQIYYGNQWVISKVTRSDGRMFAFAAKGGHNEEPHNHNDLGHFILHADGVNVLADVGIGMYTRQYFQPEHRYQMINAGSHGHSVPIVDGYRQSFGKDYRTELLHASQTEDEVQFALDMTKAYSCPSLERLTRRFIWERRADEYPRLTITEQAVFNRTPVEFQEVFISSVEPREIRPGRVQLNSVTMIYDPEQWSYDVDPVEVDSYTKQGSLFYRLLLTHRNPAQELVVNIRFEIADRT
ncbi:heparinase II/III family protein [Paenibacillus montanisoli]|uniref:Heparinase II/III-like C-terminal domain-containing protein n=1 Tax=Paenibacillus montanisoli TaxID=2081970 RepID=A0A328U5G9_9BACL|nr:heparinase II/III family protein [Paenibacillus montanisoli]RAP75156.1 hypothetical protein DL346_17390 [Paenibacillus montanisoli]